MTYVESGAVSANVQRPGDTSVPAPFESAVQPSGAWMLSRSGALRSGWSKQAKIRLALSRNVSLQV
jgi:hypothetical protein